MYSSQVKAFKNRLRNYNYITEQIDTLRNRIEDLYDQLGGVRGVDPSKEPIHSPPNKDMEYKLRDLITRQEKNLRHMMNEKDEIDSTLLKIESSLRWAIINVYVNGEKMVKVAGYMYLSTSGLLKRMNKAIKKALD